MPYKDKNVRNAKSRKRYAAMHPDAKRALLDSQKMAYKNMTPEQKARKVARSREIRDGWTPEQRDAYNSKQREKRANWSPVQVRRNHEQQKKSRDGISTERRAARRGYMKKYNSTYTHWSKSWCDMTQEQRDIIRAKNRDYRRRRRMELIDMLGGPRCVWCGETWEILLNIDHIYDDGKKDRRGGSDSAVKMMARYRKDPARARRRLQVLCYSCNQAKMLYVKAVGSPKYPITLADIERQFPRPNR